MQIKIQIMKTKLLYIATLLLISIYSLEAQTDISFKTICKKQVSVGEQFQVSYELNGDGKDFKAPNFTNFEIIIYPSTKPKAPQILICTESG